MNTVEGFYVKDAVFERHKENKLTTPEHILQVGKRS